MKAKVDLAAIYTPSEDIVVREIEGELIIVPLVAGIADIEEELFTLNETGRAIWDKLDGNRRLNDVVEELSSEFEDPAGDIQRDVIGLVAELLTRRMIVEASER